MNDTEILKNETINKENDTTPKAPVKQGNPLHFEWTGDEKEIHIVGCYGENTGFTIHKNGGISYKELNDKQENRCSYCEDIDAIAFSDNTVTIFRNNKKPIFISLKPFQGKKIALASSILRLNGVVTHDNRKSREYEGKLIVNSFLCSVEYDGGSTLKVIELVHKKYGSNKEYVPTLTIVDLNSTKLGYWKNYSSLYIKGRESLQFDFFSRKYVKLLVERLTSKGYELKRFPESINELLKK
jgi:hypothetical protein